MLAAENPPAKQKDRRLILLAQKNAISTTKPSTMETNNTRMPRWLKSIISIEPFKAPTAVADPVLFRIMAAKMSQ